MSIIEYRALLQKKQQPPGSARKKARTGVDGTLLEEGEQRLLAEFLDAIGVPWFHVPNGGVRCAAEGGKLKAQGVKPGVPDNFIVAPPPNGPPDCPGTIIELKRKNGGVVSADQKRWLAFFETQGWTVKVCNGADEAIAFVERLGYTRDQKKVEKNHG